MAFLQTLDAFCQPLGAAAITPTPYTIDPFCQPLTEEVVPPPPPPPPPTVVSAGGGGPAGIRLPVIVCPEGMYWDPVKQRCCPYPLPPRDPPAEPDRPKLSASEARTAAAAIALTIEPPLGYEVLAAEIGLKIEDESDEDC